MRGAGEGHRGGVPISYITLTYFGIFGPVKRPLYGSGSCVTLINVNFQDMLLRIFGDGVYETVNMLRFEEISPSNNP